MSNASFVKSDNLR